MSRNVWAILVAILLCGAGLRFHALERQSLWDDEMSTRKMEYLPLAIWPALFHAYETHPPLYFVQLRAWQNIFGDSLKAQRANSAFWGSLALLLIFLLMRLYRGEQAGLVAAALLSLSPYHLAYSQEMRSYSFTIALCLFGFYWIEWHRLRKRGIIFWLGLTMIFTAEVYTHYWGAFVVCAQFLVLWLQAADVRERRKLVVCGAIAAVLFSAWLPTLMAQLRVVPGLNFWVPPASPLNLVKTAIAYTGLFFYHASFAFRAPAPAPALWLIGLLTWAVAIYGMRKGPRPAWIWLCVGLAIPYLISYAVNGLYVWYRYPILMYPAFVCLIASGIAAMPQRVLRRAVLTLLLLMSSWSCYAYKTAWQKANPKSVVAYVQTLKTPHTVVIRPTYFSPLFAFYDHGPTETVDQDKCSSPESRAALKGKDIIFVAFDVPEDPVRDALLQEYTVKSQRYFPGHSHLGITVYQLQSS